MRLIKYVKKLLFHKQINEAQLDEALNLFTKSILLDLEEYADAQGRKDVGDFIYKYMTSYRPYFNRR